MAEIHFHNDIKMIGLSVLVFMGTFLGLMGIKKIILKKRGPSCEIQKYPATELFFHLLEKTHFLFFLILSFLMMIHSLPLSKLFSNLNEKVILVISMIQVCIWTHILISFLFNRYIQSKSSENVVNLSALNLLKSLITFSIYSLLCLMTLNGLGINITALMAGFGIGGIAVALAVQNILSDLFASLTIFLDRPFLVGDLIFIGEDKGRVESIGLKTTRIRSLSGEQLIFPNGNLLKIRICNLQSMTERRVSFLLNIHYNTSQDHLSEIPIIIKNIISNQNYTRFEGCYFRNYGMHSLEFETIYWVISLGFDQYLKIHSSINLEIFKTFTEKQIQFASLSFPPSTPLPPTC